MKRFIPVFGLVVVLACLAAGGASALTFQDRTCDNSKPTCPMPPGNAEVPYQFDMYARSGCPPYHYGITGGTPPPGLTLTTVNDSASGGIGRMSGTPTTPGDYSFWVTITTPESSTCLGDRADRLFTLTIGQAPLAIKTQSLRRGIVGEPYSETLVASGGGNQTWSASGLPAGLSLNGNSITGTPTTAGDYTVTITVTNGTTTKSAQFLLKVIEPLKVTAPARRTAEVGRLFSAKFQITGGSGKHTLVATGVPEGLAFDAVTGVLAGTPEESGVYVVKILATDSDAALTQEFDLTLKIAEHVRILTKRLKAAFVGQAYAFMLQARDGVRPYKWKRMSRVPAGLRFNERTGKLVGTPTRAGTFEITLRVIDGLRASFTQTFDFTVRE